MPRCARSQWSPIADPPPLFDGDVYAVEADANGGLYVGGIFSHIDGAEAFGIAYWDGSTWSPLGTGVGRLGANRGAVYALEMSGERLYVGGMFSRAGGIDARNVAMWDGQQWHALGDGIGTDVAIPVAANALASDGQGGVYVGGHFYTAGGQSANNIAHWNGMEWAPLGAGTAGTQVFDDFRDAVYALAVDANGWVYAGGAFTAAGGIPASRLAVWNGAEWSDLAGGVGGPEDSSVSKIVVEGTNLYVAGRFAEAGGATAWNLAKWDGSVWAPMGDGSCDSVTALGMVGDMLYASATLNCTLDRSAWRFGARWDGGSWQSLDAGLGGYIYDFAPAGPGVIVASRVSFSSGPWVFSGIARWEPPSTGIAPVSPEPSTRGLELLYVYPHPVGDSGTIAIRSTRHREVIFEVYDLVGRRHERAGLIVEAGITEIAWRPPHHKGPLWVCVRSGNDASVAHGRLLIRV